MGYEVIVEIICTYFRYLGLTIIEREGNSIVNNSLKQDYWATIEL